MVAWLINILCVLCLIWLARKGVKWLRERVWFRYVVIGAAGLFVLLLVILISGCPFFFDYFEHPRYTAWCWGPKNEKGEYTVLYTKFGSKVRHLKGAGMLGYKKVGSFSKICQVNIDGSGDKVLFEWSGPDTKEPDPDSFSLRDYCQKTNCILGINYKGFWKVNLADKSRKLITSERGTRESIANAEFSPDGSKVAFVSRPS
ncbi:MAG: hypothetical protein AAB296_10770, partial [Candidatus Desantisbacteria bacterium]